MGKCSCGKKLGKKKSECYPCEYARLRNEKYLNKRDVVYAYKSQPCQDCGKSYPPHVMDFDHVRGKKSFTIGSGLMRRKLETVLKEIAKCDVVCSNCHRERTHRRRQSE